MISLVRLEEYVVEVVDGKSSVGDPILGIVRRGALIADEVKEVAERVRSIADQHGLEYDGVECYAPIDEEEIFGWLPPEGAGWRLRHMTDCGLEDDTELPWAFLVLTPDLDSTKKIANGLTALGFNDRDEYNEPDNEGRYGLCVFVAGRNNEFQLADTSNKIAELAQQHGGGLEGVQFYTREDLNGIFGDEDN